MWKEEKFRWRIRVLPETLALALRGETQIRWRKDPNERRGETLAIGKEILTKGETLSHWKENSSKRKRRKPTSQEGEANAARRSSSEPSAQGRRTTTLQRGALAFKEKDLALQEGSLTLQGGETLALKEKKSKRYKERRPKP